MTLHPELIYLMGRNEMLPYVSLLRNLRALVEIIKALKYCAMLWALTLEDTVKCEVLDRFWYGSQLNPPRKFVDLSVTFGGVGSLKFSFWAHATALPVLMLSSWLFFGRESIVFNVLPYCKFIDHFCAKRAWSHCRTNSRSGGPLNGGLVLFAGTKRTWVDP